MGRSGGQVERSSKKSSTEKATVVVKHTGFEVVAVADAVPELRAGRIPIQDCLVMDDIFIDAKKGIRATDTDLTASFPEATSKSRLNREIVLSSILMQGSYQVSAAERKRLQEQRTAFVINYFSTHFVDPKTGATIPSSRVATAIAQAGVNLSYQEQLEKQLRTVRKALAGILALKEVKRD